MQTGALDDFSNVGLVYAILLFMAID